MGGKWSSFGGYFQSYGGYDIFRVVEEVKQSDKVIGLFNATFIVLIPKVDYLDSFDGFRPITLYNCVYKIISKLLVRLYKFLSTFISPR
jgi:hypothetical protein